MSTVLETEVPSRKEVVSYVKRAGPLLLGPQLCTSPVKCLSHCLARKDKSDEFYTVKLLTLPDPSVGETTDDIQGRILIHTEYNLLKFLKGHKGVIQQYGMYKDLAEEEVEVGGKGYTTGRIQTRICLVLDCYMPHDFSPKYTNLINLQQYVIKEKKLPESLAIKIFYNVVQVVSKLHDINVVHRDLKLGNIILDKDTMEVTISNFGLGRLLTTENEQLRDQRGSPAYISPDVISGKPYVGKPSDMWALGVLLYTMLYGQFPFYDSSPTELFRKIKLADYTIPTEFTVSQPTVKLIQSLLVLDPKRRLTASASVERCKEIILSAETFLVDSDLQVVPEFNHDDYQPRSKLIRHPVKFPEVNGADIEMMLAELSNPPDSNKSDSKDEDETVHEPPTKITPPNSYGGLANVKVMCVDDDPTNIVSPGDLSGLFRERLRSSDGGGGNGDGTTATTTSIRGAIPSVNISSSYNPPQGMRLVSFTVQTPGARGGTATMTYGHPTTATAATPTMMPNFNTTSNTSFVVRSNATTPPPINPIEIAARKIVVARRRRNEKVATAFSKAIAKRSLNIISRDSSTNTQSRKRIRVLGVAR